jgi:hypothetical protein
MFDSEWFKDEGYLVAFCRLLRDFEREARTDGMPEALLAQRKKALANELNDLIRIKKELGVFAERNELFEGAAGPSQGENLDSRCAAS